MRLGTALSDVNQDDDGVSVRLQPSDGAGYRLRARYVIAADGAGSPIRDALGIGRSGRGLLSTQRSILFQAPIDHYLGKGVVQFEIEQPTLTAFLTTYSDGRWVLMLSDDIDRDADQQRAAVLRGDAAPGLLDTYDAERRPIAWLRHDQIFARADYQAHRDASGGERIEVIDDIAMELGQLYRSSAVLHAAEALPAARRPDQWAGQPGTRAPHLAMRRDTSTLDLFGHGWVLLSQDNSWAGATECDDARQSLG